MVNFSFESDIDNIKVIKPDIPGNLVSALAPDVFLLIKGRLVRRKIFQMKFSMAFKKKPDFFSFMPFGSIHIEIDNKTAELFQHILQYQQKSLPVTFGGAYQAFPPQQGSHPAGQIEPLAMLAGGRNFEPLTFLSPTSPKAGMQAKAGLILKNDGFIVFKVLQFFLTPPENGGHPWHELEDKHSWLVSGCILSNVTSIAPAALSTSVQTASSGVSPKWAHPRHPLTDQIPEETFRDVALIASSQMVLIESDVPDEFGVSKKLFPSDLPRESSLPGSCDLARTKRLSIPDADPPKPAIRQQFSAQSMPPGLALPWLIAFLGLLQFALYSKLSWSKYNSYFVNVQVFSAFVLVRSRKQGRHSYLFIRQFR